MYQNNHNKLTPIWPAAVQVLPSLSIVLKLSHQDIVFGLTILHKFDLYLSRKYPVSTNMNSINCLEYLQLVNTCQPQTILWGKVKKVYLVSMWIMSVWVVHSMQQTADKQPVDMPHYAIFLVCNRKRCCISYLSSISEKPPLTPIAFCRLFDADDHHNHYPRLYGQLPSQNGLQRSKSESTLASLRRTDREPQTMQSFQKSTQSLRLTSAWRVFYRNLFFLNLLSVCIYRNISIKGNWNWLCRSPVHLVNVARETVKLTKLQKKVLTFASNVVSESSGFEQVQQHESNLLLIMIFEHHRIKYSNSSQSRVLIHDVVTFWWEGWEKIRGKKFLCVDKRRWNRKRWTVQSQNENRPQNKFLSSLIFIWHLRWR